MKEAEVERGRGMGWGGRGSGRVCVRLMGSQRIHVRLITIKALLRLCFLDDLTETSSICAPF